MHTHSRLGPRAKPKPSVSVPSGNSCLQISVAAGLMGHKHDFCTPPQNSSHRRSEEFHLASGTLLWGHAQATEAHWGGRLTAVCVFSPSAWRGWAAGRVLRGSEEALLNICFHESGFLTVNSSCLPRAEERNPASTCPLLSPDTLPHSGLPHRADPLLPSGVSESQGLAIALSLGATPALPHLVTSGPAGIFFPRVL